MKSLKRKKGFGLLMAMIVLLALVPTSAGARPRSKAPLRVRNLTVEHMTSPLGIDTSIPRFGWIVEANYNGAEQTAYEIRVSSKNSRRGHVWSSGRVKSGASFDVEYDGKPLQPNTRYYWSVRVWDHGRSSPWSKRAWFETAFLDVNQFGGEWIGSATEAAEQEILLRKNFSLSKMRIASARLYIAGLGYYKAYINGKRVGDRELDPAYTPFLDRLVYVTHDVTKLLKRRHINAIGVSLGQGYYGRPVLKLQLDVTYINGTTETIVSDLSWKTDHGPTTFNRVATGGGFDPTAPTTGEIYDAQREQPGWNAPAFDDAGWANAIPRPAPAGVLQAMDVEPIRVTGELPAPVVSEISPGLYLCDFQTTRAGWATVSMEGPAGATVTMKYAEKLKDDGTVDNASGFGGSPALQKYIYTLKGDGVETFTPSYSYVGYRFLQIEVPEGVTISSVVGKTLNTDVPMTGTFTSSDELLNRYHNAMLASTLSNLHSIPTDTPMWEKAGWTADGHLIADNALLNFGSENLWEKWMRDHRYNQAADGGINWVVPGYPKGGVDPVWSASYILVNYALYEKRGNIRTLEENYDGMKLWMEKWMTYLTGTGYVWVGDPFPNGTWGDHEPAYGNGMNNQIVASAFIYETAKKLAVIANALGYDADAAAYEIFAGQVRVAVNNAFYDPVNKFYNWPYDGGGFGPPPTPEEIEEINANQFQTDNVLPIALDLVPEEDRQALCQNLLDDVRVTQESHITTGATVLKDVLPVLTECGDAELGYAAAVNPTFPGWGYWFLMLDGSEGPGGETIIVDTHWEAWYEEARSRNHAFRGTIDDWLYEYVAGIQPAAPAYREIRIKPYPVGDLTEVSAYITSPLGEVSSSWKRHGERLRLRVHIPVGARAKVLVPVGEGDDVSERGGARFVGTSDGYAEFQVGSGDYKFWTK